MKKHLLKFACVVVFSLLITTGLSAQTNPGTADLIHEWTFDIDAKDNVGDIEGALMDGAEIIDGSLELLAGSAYLQFPENMGISALDELTIEVWFISTSANTSFTSLFYFGSQKGEAKDGGYKYLIFQPTRGDGVSKLDITSDNWCCEVGSTGIMLNDDAQHHMAAVIDAESITYYLDGEAVGDPVVLDEDHSLAQVVDSLNCIGKSGYNDPFWQGSVQKMSMFNKALTADNVQFLFENGDKSILTSVEIVTTSQLEVYPNPATNFISLRGVSGTANIEVVDLQGRTVLTQANVENGQNVSLNKLSTGMYMVKVAANNSISSQKIIVRQ